MNKALSVKTMCFLAKYGGPDWKIFGSRSDLEPNIQGVWTERQMRTALIRTFISGFVLQRKGSKVRTGNTININYLILCE